MPRGSGDNNHSPLWKKRNWFIKSMLREEGWKNRIEMHFDAWLRSADQITCIVKEYMYYINKLIYIYNIYINIYSICLYILFIYVYYMWCMIVLEDKPPTFWLTTACNQFSEQTDSVLCTHKSHLNHIDTYLRI